MAKEDIGAIEDDIQSAKAQSDQSRYYKNGRLVRVGKLEKAPHYRQSTGASRRRARTLGSSEGLGSWEDSPDDIRTTLWEIEHQPLPPSPAPTCPDLECLRCAELQAARTATGPKTLAGYFRLDDIDFRKSAASLMTIPSRTTSRLLSSGLYTAKDIIWNAMRMHWPKMQRFYWLGGPHEVKLGRPELQSVFGGEEMPRNHYNDLCSGPDSAVNYAILRLPDLRNTVAHNNYVSLRAADSLLYDVQHLAVMLQDELRALKVRRLRGTLQVEGERAVKEIECVYSIMWDPVNSSCERKLHHQQTFSNVVAVSRHCDWSPESRETYSTYPDYVKCAAWDWHSRCRSVGDGAHSAEYLALVKKASRVHA